MTASSRRRAAVLLTLSLWNAMAAFLLRAQDSGPPAAPRPGPDGAPAVQGSVMLEDFEAYTEDTQLAKQWYRPPHGGGTRQTRETLHTGGGRQSLKWEYHTTNDDSTRYSAICRVAKWDATGCNAVQFWLKPDGSGRKITLQLNIANRQGRNIHDLWQTTFVPRKGDTAGRVVTIPFASLEHNVKYADSPDTSPVFKPEALIEIAFYINGRDGEPGDGVYYLDEIRAVRLDPARASTPATATAGPASASESATATAPQWQEVELTFTATRDAANAYTETDAWADFTHQKGARIRRPLFWDGGRTFRVRFASTESSGTWRWTTSDRAGDPGLDGHSGSLIASPTAPETATIFTRHGFWSIPPGGRNLVHADGTARLLCADTPWALPWRATVDQAETYARDRQAKGFNAALLMTVQPDMDCQGPRSRTEDLGFDVGFEDLPQGTLRRLRPEYFQMFDRLTGILVAHGVAPVYQPVFHGYGWKGRRVAGNAVSAEDYARYCRYLVARYGARPAIWLLGGDGPVTDPKIVEQLDQAGQTVEAWDAYRQPTGIHYSPHALFRAHQDKAWLDFQWCQTGHQGDHLPERVAHMWHHTPVKAVANGEPTYENIAVTGRAAGWWQGHEAWCNLTAGGTMGMVYGAGSLWQWRRHAAEPDHADWCTAPGAGWREALDFEGSRYPGIVARIFEGLPFADMQPNWTYTYGQRGLAVPGRLFVLYLPEGGRGSITSLDVPRAYRILDPRTGQETGQGRLPDRAPAPFNSGASGEPRVMVFLSGERTR